MIQDKKRTYEISIWTLQDEFITILKASNIENKGQIINGKTTIRDDGTLELSFSIPMYYYEDDVRIENPIWYSTRNGVIIQDMRKIKLIFNKNTEEEKVFEFLITSVNENHQSDILTCEVNTESMIFNELGKWGYKVSLSSDEFYARDYDYFVEGSWRDDNGYIHSEAPRGTLQYWLNHFLTPLPNNTDNLDITKWYYSIEMDWSAYDSTRASNIVYEDEYTGSWQVANSSYIPHDIVSAKEKERMVDLEESNAYNLTQELAEAFGVFCRYEYLYDDNYHIIGRRIIFYNNYMRENEGYLDLTYPYSTAAITRTKDSKDVTTKMFVRPVTEETSASGLITILDVAANKSKEDYLLNFDYLKTVDGITDEQYAEIDSYEYKIGQKNATLQSLEGPLIALRNRVPELEAAIALHTNAAQLDKERISACNDLLNELDKKDEDEDGAITIKDLSPRTAILLESTNSDNEGAYYINLTDHGVILETLKIYRGYDFVQRVPDTTTELKTGTPEYDEFGNIIKINNLYLGSSNSRTVYLTYKYIPHLYYERVLNTWTARLGIDEAALQEAQRELEAVQERISTLQSSYDSTLASKKELIADFDRMMGPALRESYWQPEDYKDHGDNHIDTFTVPSNANSASIGSSSYTQLIWDTQLFDGEQDTTYEYSANQITQYYPCIKLGNNLSAIQANIDKLSFLYYDYIPDNPNTLDIHNIRNFPVGSLCQYGFIKINSQVEPVLILTGTTAMTSEQIAAMKDSNHHPQIGVLTTTVGTNGISTTIESSIPVNSTMWVTSSTPIFPRIEVASLALKTSSDMMGVTYEGVELKNYEDYYITINSKTAEGSQAAYYITIKPRTMLSLGTITGDVRLKFNLSNANTAIYLDAIQVLKENAYPKVSYTIDPSVIDKNLLYTLYNQLNRICNINDTELKFENVQGYISELELDLDHPENDRIEIKNYKTKFEDLFTSIVAQTEAMKKSAYTIGLAANAFTSNGELDATVLKNSVMKVDLNYAFNNGKLTIDEKNGIWGISDSGVVAFRGGGIFTATDKDSNGNWKWNTGIVPQGINADLISTGQLDTNKINIYAGDRVRFQLNGNGLFAYKSFFEDLNILDPETSQSALEKMSLAAAERGDDLDVAQYVVMNQNGLFLIGESGALVLNNTKTDYQTLENTVKRVEISWEGLKLRNWNNEEVFWADPNTGNLHLTGEVVATAFRLADNATIQQGDVSYNLSTMQTAINTASTTNIQVHYATSDDGEEVPLTGWGSTYPTNITPGTYIWTRTVITYGSGSSKTTYQITYIPMDGEGSPGAQGPKGDTGVSIASITCLYYLKSNTTAPQKPRAHIENSSTGSNQWTTAVPDYINGFYYFRCEEYYYSNGAYGWSEPYIDYGITVANQTATEASAEADNIINSLRSLINTNQISESGTFSNYTWNNKTYGLALTSSNGMLIGANNGITVVNTNNNGAAVVIDKGGIALNGATINLKASATDSTSVISLSPTAINIGSTATVNIGARNNSITLNSSGLTIKASKFQMEDADHNLQDLWSRNDIIIMKAASSGSTVDWRSDLDLIEAKMSGEHDWVLIKPFYNASCSYLYDDSLTINPNASISATLPQEGTEKIAFGNSAAYYDYNLGFFTHCAEENGSNNIQFTIKLSTYQDFRSGQTIILTKTYTYGIYTSDVLLSVATHSEGSGKINLCQEDRPLFIQISHSSSLPFVVHDIFLYCSTDSTTSKVPCTVYYYP